MTDESSTGTKTAGGNSISRLVSASALMAAGTMISRILGFVRVGLLAFVLGNTTRQADMYAVATSVPTSLYILFAGGALNTVLVPQLVRAVRDDPDGGEAYTNRIMTAFLLIVGAVAGILTLATPWVIQLYSSDKWRAPELAAHYDSMLLLGYLCLPEVFFYGVFFLLGQVLNARDKFGPMMWAPIANNVISIVVLIAYLGIFGHSALGGSEPFTVPQAVMLGGGATLGIVVQTAVMAWCMRSVNFKFRPRFDLRGTGLGHTFHLAKWTLGYVLVNQLALIVVDRLATSATAGGSGAGLLVYNNAYLVWILPHSLITVSLATAMLPSASRLAAANDLHGVREESMRTLRLATSVLLPAAAAFIALAHPLAMLMFGHGKGAADAQFVAWTLIALALGLVPFTVQYICLRTFYALEDTRSTFFLQCLIAGCNVVFAVVLVLPWNAPNLVAPGLALAYSLAYTVGVGASFHHLGRRVPNLSAAELLKHLARVTAAVAPAALAAYLIVRFLGRDDSKVMTAVALVIAGVVALALFFGAAKLLKITEVSAIIDTLIRRRRGGSGAKNDRSGPDQDQSGPRSGGDAPSADPANHNEPPTENLGTIAAAAPATAAVSVPVDSPMTAEREAQMDEDPEQTAIRPVASSDSDQTPPSGVTPNGAWSTGNGSGNEPGNDTEDTAEEIHPIKVSAGQRLGDRYRLDEVLVRRETTQTWRAFDEVLSRSVLIHLLAADDQNNPAVLDAARKASVATDSRFLRVLDAALPSAPESEKGVGPYVVCEYAPGQSLEEMLSAGPLSALEAAWLVREVAEALAGMHAQRLFHQRISPDTLVITAAGNVKIVGFLLEAVLSDDTDEPGAVEDPEARDVTDLGRLLYCTLVSRWPGRNGYGMPQAPTDVDGNVLTPRQVRAGVSPALDRICDQILSASPRQREEPLRTSAEVVAALSKVLGTADASHDLERRLRYPVPLIHLEDEPPPPAMPYADAETGKMMPFDDAPTQAHTPASPGPATEINPPQYYPPAPRRSEPGHRWLKLLIAAVIIVMLCSLVAVALTLRGGGDRPVDTGKGTPSPTVVAEHRIVAASDFDPEGNDKREHPEQVALSYDNSATTAWKTMTYRNPKMDKRGVGIIYDLGSGVRVSEIQLALEGQGSNVEIRVPANNADKTTQAPTDNVDQWRQVGKQDGAGEKTTITVSPAVTSRFVLVMFTELPRGSGGYQGGIAETVIKG